MRLLYDHNDGILVVVNLEDNSFTHITGERIERENEVSADQGAPGIDSGGEPAANSDETAARPTPIAAPQQSHPAGCTAYARALPQGLKEETCFKSWERMGFTPPDLETFASLFSMIRELRRPPSELKVVIALAEAFSWDAGLLVSRREFGDSPFEEDTVGLQPWDVVVELKEVKWIAPEEEAFELPEDAEEKFTLVPWRQPLRYYSPDQTN